MNKTLQSDCQLILKRYHPNRLAHGTNYIREMDEMIDKLSNNKGGGQSYRQLWENQELRRSNKSNRNSRSKFVMKKIINNQLWNDLIDMTYKRSFSHQPRGNRNMFQIQRGSLVKSEATASEKSHRKLIKTVGNSPSSFFKTKLKVGCRNLFEYYNPSNLQSSPKDPSKNNSFARPSAKMVHEYKARQLKWQNKFLPHYDESNEQPIQNQMHIL